MKSASSKFPAVALLLFAALFGWKLYTGMSSDTGNTREKRGSQPVAVETAQILTSSIEYKRTFSGALEASEKFVVAPKVSGRVNRLAVDISDTVSRGQIVALLDNGEFIQAVEQAKADVIVGKANLVEAKSILKIASREVKRIETLLESKVAYEAQHDEAKLKEVARQARVKVAKAQLVRAESALVTAEIRLGYTKVVADWAGGDDERIVAERYIDEGDTVSANTPIAQIVELNPLKGVFFVTEKDYARLKTGQTASLFTDAYPGEFFSARITRIAPIFLRSTRQARVELTVDNSMNKLKPGMFMQTTVTLGKIENATIVPEQALTTRNDKVGVFVVNKDGKTVAWREVMVGVREGGQTQVEGDDLEGQVVTLGQHLLEEGSMISAPANESETDPGENRKGNQ